MEFLELNLDEFSQIERRNINKYDFPVVSFFKYNGSPVISFNKACEEEFGYVKYLKIYGNAEYLVFSLTDTKDSHCFAISYGRRSNPHVISSGVERFAVVGKTYKLYKTPKGYAIKLNEPIFNRKESK